MMTKMIHDRATHSYALGFSKTSETLADERIARERQNPPVIVSKPRTYEELLAENDALKAELAALKAAAVAQVVKSRRSPSGGKPRGRRTAESVIMRNRVTYYSMAHVAKLAGVNQSTVSRQVNRLGIKPELIGGINYIPASQASNIQRRKRQP
jgi:hypothetical protein